MIVYPVIFVIDTCFSLIKSSYSLKIQMWFYHHKTINFMYPFVLEQTNLGKLLTENMIINQKITNSKKPKSQIQASIGSE